MEQDDSMKSRDFSALRHKMPVAATPSTLFARSADLLKPHRNEAAIRLRNSGFGILSIIILTNLLPFPSPWTSLRTVAFSSANGAWWYLCAAELALVGVLTLNMLQSVYALKYPRAPLPPLSSPARPKGITSPPSAKRHFRALSPNTSPQQQRSFSSSYASSPISTPSRVINYSIPSMSPSPFNVSTGGTSMSLPPTPSPILSAFRGKHLGSVGHAFDGTLLSRLAAEDSDADD